jgi:hypothetical protein
MKKIFLLFAAVLVVGKLSAQNQPRRQQATPPPVPVREVSGIVKDTTDATVPGAVVKIESKTDTVSVATNMDGIFVLKNVKAASFVLTVSSIGYATTVRSMKLNDAVAHLVLDPIILKSDVHKLNEVTINGTPSIVYKPDTVEYKASDYHVRENATLDELLKKMEGFEVGSDGSVTHQGQAITKLRLNGKNYAGGDVAQAIQTLPADIIEKAQVIDDYGDLAARTGVRDGDPQKVLNVTTLANRSIGTNVTTTAQAGSHERYNTQISLLRINANQQIGINGRLNNTITGVASTGSGQVNGNGGGGGGGRGGSNPGTSHSGSPSISYADQYGPKVEVNNSYAYQFNNNESTSNSFGKSVSTKGYTYFNRGSANENDSYSHRLNLQLKYSIDSSNFLQVEPSLNYRYSNSSSTSNQDNIKFLKDDSIRNKDGSYTFVPAHIEHQVTSGTNVSETTTPNYALTAFFLHTFKKPRRNLSIQVSGSSQNQSRVSEKNNTYNYYQDSTLNIPLPKLDSLAHTFLTQNSDNKSYRGSLTYSEPIGNFAQLQFNAQTTTNLTDNVATQDKVGADGIRHRVDSLDNIFNTKFTESKVSLTFNYNNGKINFNVGVQAIPSILTGDKVDNSNGGDVAHTSVSNFNVVPVFHATYSWSRTERLTLSYSGGNSQPNFDQMQPFIDRTNPLNIIVGNQHLKTSFNNTYNLAYNNYFPNSKFNVSVNAAGSFVSNQVSSNTVQSTQLIKVVNPDTSPGQPDSIQTPKSYNTTYYVNLNGTRSYTGNYNISKQLDDRRYNLALNGRVSYRYNVAMSNNELYHNTQWNLEWRFGPRISPSDNVEINPYVQYNVIRSFTSLSNRSNSNTKTTSLSIDGRFYFLKTFQVNYYASQQFTSGLVGLNNTTPLTINAGFEKEFLARRNLVLTFNMYDLLHQNNSIQQDLSDNGGYTNTVASTLSRYFMIGLRYRFQKWSGTPQRGGRNMQRRNDGSFIYN